METRVYEVESKDQAKFKALVEKDPYAKTSFAFNGYKLKDAKMVGGEAGKYVLYLKAEAPFFAWAEKQFAESGIPSIKRAPKEAEAKIAAEIEAEDNAAEVGMGSIFG